MRFLDIAIVLILNHMAFASAATEETPKPCSIVSPRTGSHYDLLPMAVTLPEDGKYKKDSRNESWHARGYDYGSNFTLNFCAPVVEQLEDVVGVEKSLWRNVSAYYEQHGKTYSIGQASAEPIFRGRKLVMNYTDGSPCGQSHSRRGIIGDGGDDDRDDRDDRDNKDRDGDRPSKGAVRRKNTIISFLCEQGPADPSRPKVAVSFVSSSPDECTYVFEVRSHLSCGGTATPPEAVGPGGVFGLIVVITIVVYVLGGIAYQRTVMHQRGWRQLPNYGMWAGVASFFKDTIIAIFSSCCRLIPRRRGYNQIPTHSTRGRGINREEENGLIDQLDEEWDD